MSVLMGQKTIVTFVNLASLDNFSLYDKRACSELYLIDALKLTIKCVS